MATETIGERTTRQLREKSKQPSHWKNQLRIASWKGLDFRVESTDLTGGWDVTIDTIPVKETAASSDGNKEAEQKIANQLRPGAESAKAKDISRKVKTHHVAMHFVGPNYLIYRNSMIALLDEGGHGDLILPSMGKIKAIAGEYRTMFDNKEGGYEFLEVDFYEVSSEPQLIAWVDTSKQLNDSSTAAKDELGNSFAYSAKTPSAIAGEEDEPSADFVLEAAEELAVELQERLFNEIGLGTANEAVNGYVKDLNDFKDSVSTIVRSPETYIDQIRTLTEGLTEIFEAPSDIYESSKRVFQKFGHELSLIKQSTPDRVQQFLNQESVVFSVKTVAATNMSTSAAALDFETAEDVSLIREFVVDSIDDLLTEIGDSQQRQEIFDSLNDVKIKFISAISNAASDLPGLKTITTSSPMPAIVTAYNLYADADRQDEIIERNKVENPLFCPTELEVLSS